MAQQLDPVKDILGKDIERVNQAIARFQAGWRRWDPFGPETAKQQGIVERLRREVEAAEERLNQAFLSAPTEVRKLYLKRRLMR